MPRARINEASEDVVIKKPRATRKPRVVSLDSESTSAPRRRPVSRVNSSVEETPVVRKAPTAVASQRRRRTKNTKLFISVILVCLMLSAIGIGIGVFGKGAIDVVAVVNERNEKINKGEIRDDEGQAITKTVEVQNSDARPNGGLILGDAPVVPEPTLEPATTTATSSDEVASSTESIPAETINEVETTPEVTS